METISDNVDAAIQRHQAGDLSEAEQLFTQALQAQPENTDILRRLALIAQQSGRLNEAESLYCKILKIQPDYVIAQYSLGELLQQQNRLDEAIAAYQKVLALNPKHLIAASVLNKLGNILQQQNKLEKAVQAYQQALTLNPDLVKAHYNLGNVLDRQGKLEAALQSYEQAFKLDPSFVHAKFAICMRQLPIVYASWDEIQLRRNRYQSHLEQLADYYRAVSLDERAKAAEAVGSDQPFLLAYQGFSDRQLQQVYGEMICQLMASRYPQWSRPIPLPKLAAEEKIRVGIVSGFFREHSNWKIPIKGWVENLNKSEFELFGYHTSSIRQGDRETLRAAKVFDKFIQGPLSLEQWCEAIAQDKLHVLLFPEFGMDPITVQLGCLRLAYVQMTSWGHPETSGLPTIDYYLSSDLMEPENGQDHYTEKLVRLPNLSIHYMPLKTQPQAIRRSEIGIAEDDIMFWCCQSLYKYLPQYDDVFPRIAKELVNSKFVFIKNIGEHVTEVFEQRLSYAFQQFGLNYQDYCKFLPFMNPQSFAGVTSLADVFLDSIGWSGCNSTLEAIAYNLPIVTLPGDLMRGRHTMAILKMMGIEEMIAADKDEYVKIAVRLGQDLHYRQYLSKQIAERKHKLYGDLEPVRALEDFLVGVVQKPRKTGVTEVTETLRLAVQHHQANRLDEAEQVYHQILEKQPNHPEALHGLGMIAQQMGQYQAAERFLSAALQVQPDAVKTWFSLGNLHQVQGQWLEAVEAYKRALALRPDSAPISNNLGYAFQQQGQWEKAIACYQNALKLQPNCTEANVNLGNALYAQGKLSAERQIHYAALNNQLGASRKKAGDLKTAVMYHRQAIAMQPDLWEAHYNLGVALQEQGQLAEAIACHQKALELNPNCGEAYLQLGQIYQTQNHLSQAAFAYFQGLKLVNPHYAKAIKAHQESAASPKDCTPPQLQLGEVTVGKYQFPAIPPVPDSEQKRPFWSVIIPVYNRTDYLLECLASVLGQWSGNEEMEILVIDNGSTPPLYDLVNSIGGGIVRYYRNPENIGAQRNFNLGVALSRGQWIHLLHDDDYVLPGFYSQLKKSLEGCSGSVGAAFTGYENIDEHRKVVFSNEVYGKYRGIAQDWLWQIGTGCRLNLCAVVIRREAYERLGGYNLTHTCDWELYKRIAVFYDWWYEPGILAHFRQHPHSISAQGFLAGDLPEAYRKAIEISESYLPTEQCAAITAEARRNYFYYFLTETAVPLSAGNLSGALFQVQEALKIDKSPEAVTKLFTWLNRDEAAPLRDAIASLLILQPSK